MTLATTPPIADYVENGVTLVHPIPFQFRNAADIVCSRILAGVETVLTQGADFNVAGGGGGTGTVTKLAAGPAPTIFRIKRVTTRAQTTDYTPGDAFPAETHEAALDHAAAVDQEQDVQIADTMTRAVRVPVGELGGQLPPAAERAGKFFGFDGAGQPVATGGTLITITAPTLSPELFASAKPSGVIGDGTDDGPAFAAMCVFLNAIGRGTIELKEGGRYWLGSTTLKNPSINEFGAPGGVYRFFPTTPFPIDINGCTGPVNVDLNGAVLRTIDGAKFGTFNLDGTPMASALGYSGDGIGVPYFAMIRVKDCTGQINITGASELDGNIKNALIGGYWGPGFDGRQIPMTGILLQDSPNITVDGKIYVHHQGLDSLIIDAPGLLSTPDNVKIKGVTSHYSGRSGCSLVGGNGVVLEDCNFDKAGKDLGATMTYSAPGAGIDLESEGAKYVINTVLINTNCVDNTFAALIGDSSGNTFDLDVYGGQFIGTTSWALWTSRPGFRFHGATIVGAITQPYGSADPKKATQFNDCRFTLDVARSPTGVVYGGGSGGFMLDAALGNMLNVTFNRCRFYKTNANTTVIGDVSAAFAGTGLRFNSSTFEKAGGAGTFRIAGGFSGPDTAFISTDSMPSPEAGSVFVFNDGLAFDSFLFNGTRYKASADRSTGKQVFYGSAAYDPPNLAAGAKTAIQTIVGGLLTGIALGDIVQEVTFSLDLAGARIHAWVSAADTVSFYFINENGANPLDLAAGTVKVKVRKA